MDATEREWLVTSASADYHPMAKLLLKNPQLARRRDFMTGVSSQLTFFSFADLRLLYRYERFHVFIIYILNFHGTDHKRPTHLQYVKLNFNGRNTHYLKKKLTTVFSFLFLFLRSCGFAASHIIVCEYYIFISFNTCQLG